MLKNMYGCIVTPFEEDLSFLYGTIAAACGGTTTTLDVITPEPGQSLQEATAARRKEADGQATIDYGLHLTAIDATPETLEEL
jgi:dihydropyrimidinase